MPRAEGQHGRAQRDELLGMWRVVVATQHGVPFVMSRECSWAYGLSGEGGGDGEGGSGSIEGLDVCALSTLRLATSGPGRRACTKCAVGPTGHGWHDVFYVFADAIRTD